MEEIFFQGHVTFYNLCKIFHFSKKNYLRPLDTFYQNKTLCIFLRIIFTGDFHISIP